MHAIGTSSWQLRIISVCSVAALTLPSVASAQGNESFIDVPSDHPAFDAIEYLSARGMVSGYANATFRPDALVNRAEALKLIIAPIAADSDLSRYKKTVFTDVSADDWYLPYVQWGYEKLAIVQGPPKTTQFHAERPVTKAEFLKMFLLANDVDPQSFSEIKLPLAFDVKNPDEWYYPFMRYAITSSMTMVSTGGVFNPERQLTRADVAQLIYRFLQYKDGKRTQALLDEVESEIEIIIYNLERQDVLRAEYASGRAILAARGAHAVEPDEPLVKAVVKLAEGYRAVVRAYRAGINEDFDTVLKLCSDAWFIAEQGKKLKPGFAPLTQLQNDANELANSARALKNK